MNKDSNEIALNLLPFTSHLKPGGWYEFQDYNAELLNNNGKPPEDSPLVKWWDKVVSTFDECGKPIKIAERMEDMLETIGFVDISVRMEVWPLGTWPKDKGLKERGMWGRLGLIDSLLPFSMALLTRIGGWNSDEVAELCEAAKGELMAKTNRYYSLGYFITAQKPR